MGSHLLPVKEQLRAVLRNDATPRAFNHFLNLCNSIAVTLLERKAASGQLSQSMFQLTLKDLALDCIADLFRTDEHGAFVQMQVYFDCVNLDEASEEETLILLRRLVFSKVKHGLFRAYNELDPSLGKILRNIKLGIGITGEFAESDRFGDTILTPTHCDSLLAKPMLQRESLEHILAELPLSGDRVPPMLTALAHYLCNQTEHSRIVGLLSLALAWREHLSTIQPKGGEAIEIPDHDFYAQDVRRITLDACDYVKKMMKPRYVRPDSIDETTYEAYFRAIAAFLSAEMCGGNDRGSLLSSLEAELPGISESSYRTIHRNTIEYLVKLVRKRTKTDLTKAFS